jgi:ubiquinone/menaquinone biosynthesis C-methylase UbiE
MLFYPANEYVAYTKPLSEEKSALSKTDRRYGLQKRLKFVEKLVGQGKILDVGCATGAFLEEIKLSRADCWETYGVEPNQQAAHIAQKVSGARIFSGMLEAAKYPNNFFDVVTMWDVLEHVFSPKATLLEIKRILKPDGVVVFSLPNLDSWDATLFKHYWVGYDVPRHMHVFSSRTLNLLLSQTGFVEIKRNCVAGSHFYFMSNVMFYLRSKMPRHWLTNLVWHIHHSISLRLLTAPYFFLSDTLVKSTTVTHACRPLNHG